MTRDPSRIALIPTKQDRSGGSYNNVIYLIIAIKSLEVVWGPVYDFLDGRWLAHSLRLPEKKRLALRREAKERGEPYSGWHVSKKVRYTVMTQLGAMIVVAWVVSPWARSEYQMRGLRGWLMVWL
jgi:hypothetical protein